MTRAVQISIVVPIYYCAPYLRELTERLQSVLSGLTADFEIIYIDDGSPDRSWSNITELVGEKKEIRGIRLSRNFGQHHAIAAGLSMARGEWVVVMDGDLQDRPEEIPGFFRKAEEGYEAVVGRRRNRQDPRVRSFLSWVFYRVLSSLTRTFHDPSIGNFGIYHRRIIDVLLAMPEHTRFFPMMVRWVGFRQVYVDIEHARREQGTSSYSWNRRFRLAGDILLANSDTLLQIFVKLGASLCFLAFSFAVFCFIQRLRGAITLSGYASIIISIWFLGGVIISILGLVGLYVGKSYEGIRRRPLFVIGELVEGH